jgi:hypothetical protein
MVLGKRGCLRPVAWTRRGLTLLNGKRLWEIGDIVDVLEAWENTT